MLTLFQLSYHMSLFFCSSVNNSRYELCRIKNKYYWATKGPRVNCNPEVHFYHPNVGPYPSKCVNIYFFLSISEEH